MKQIPFLVGFLFASLFALGISLLGTNWWNWREIEPPVVLKDYWPVPFVFILSSLITAIILALPETANYVMAQYVDYHQKRLQAARYAREREQLKPPAPQPASMRSIESLTPLQRAWKHFLIRCTVEAIRIGTINFRNGMEIFFGGDNRKWHEYIDRLTAWEMCWPPTNRGTFWREGKSAQLVLDLLEGDQLPPNLPPYDPPSLVDGQHGGVDNTENTAENTPTRGQRDSTVFATDR